MSDERSLYKLLKLTFDEKGSDLHLKVGKAPAIRVDGVIRHLEGFRFNKHDFRKILEVLLTPEQEEQFLCKRELDFAYTLEGVCRFRVNLYQDLNGAGAVFRVIPYRVMSFDEIGLPLAARRLIEQPNGLILITGPTGAGKTSTMASYLNYVNANAKRHVVTIEDPIEYQFDDNQSFFLFFFESLSLSISNGSYGTHFLDGGKKRLMVSKQTDRQTDVEFAGSDSE